VIRCQELVELVTAYLDGVLPAQERERVDLHLAGCDGCDAYMQQLRATITLLRRTGENSH
jgi:anti-sigma factor RsiW